MNELKGKFVNIVLTIDEGHGFEVIKKPVFFTANFNGRVMESDLADPNVNPVFNSEMVWEAEKKFLRSIRTENKPIRLDWFTNESKFVGFALVQLRSAQIMPSSSRNLKIMYDTLKLLGVPREFGSKVCIQVRFSITIRDYLTNRFIPPAVSSNIKIDEDESIKIPISTKDDFIKIGDVKENLKKHHFKILVRELKNLDVLLPESLVFSEIPKKYHLTFFIFGTEVKTQYITRDLHDNFAVKELVVINLLSNPQIMEIYFQKYPTISIHFKNGDLNLGIAEVQVSRINFKNEKIVYEEESLFEAQSIEVTKDIERQASIEIKCSFELIPENDLQVNSPNVNYSSASASELNLKKVKGMRKNKVVNQKNSKIQEIFSVSSDVSLKELDRKLPPIEKIQTSDKYQCFTLSIIFETITFMETVGKKDVCLEISHPYVSNKFEIKAKIESGRKIILDNAVCKFNLVCTRNRLTPILLNLSPKLRIFEVKTGKDLSNEQIIPWEVSISEPDLLKIIQLSFDNHHVGELSFCCVLEVSDVKPIINTPYDLPPTIIDDNIIFQNIAEVETWKNQECKRFAVELGAKNRVFLENFTGVWTKRKDKLENLLQTCVEQCEKLAYDLEINAHTHLLDAEILKRKDNDELNFDLTLHKNMIKYALSDNIDLIEKITSLEIEFCLIKEIASRYNAALEDLKKTTITEDHAKNLLLEMKAIQEQNEDLKKDKSYFKHEWEKAMKEVHELKLQLQRYLQEKLADEKMKLSQLSLDSFAS